MSRNTYNYCCIECLEGLSLRTGLALLSWGDCLRDTHKGTAEALVLFPMEVGTKK